MAKAVQVKLTTALVNCTFLILAAHVVSAQFWGYPFLYCWLSPTLSTLYMAWGVVILYLVSAYIVIQLFRRGMAQALGGIVLFIAIIEFPRLADAVFRLGGSCA